MIANPFVRLAHAEENLPTMGRSQTHCPASQAREATDKLQGAWAEHLLLSLVREVANVMQGLACLDLEARLRRDMGTSALFVVLPLAVVGAHLRLLREARLGHWQGPLDVPARSVVVCAGVGS